MSPAARHTPSAPQVTLVQCVRTVLLYNVTLWKVQGPPMFCMVQAVVNCILVTANCAPLLRWLVCLTCWASARVLEPLSCTSTKAVSPSLPSTAVWRECATVHPLRVCQSAVGMQVSGVQHWVSCGVVQLACLPWH